MISNRRSSNMKDSIKVLHTQEKRCVRRKEEYS